MTDTSYRFPHFRRQLMYHDAVFEGGPRPGEPFPDFDLATVDGDRLRKSDFVGDKPLLMVFASFT